MVLGILLSPSQGELNLVIFCLDMCQIGIECRFPKNLHAALRPRTLYVAELSAGVRDPFVRIALLSLRIAWVEAILQFVEERPCRPRLRHFYAKHAARLLTGHVLRNQHYRVAQ